MRKVSFQKRFNCTEEEYFYAMLEQMRFQGSVTINVPQLPDEIRPHLADAVKVGRLMQEPIGKCWVRLRENTTAASTAVMSPDPEGNEKHMVVLRRNAEGVPTVWCDPGITDLVDALNNGELSTIASCSGHGERRGSIILKDGRHLVICNSLEDHNVVVHAVAAPTDNAALVEAEALRRAAEWCERNALSFVNPPGDNHVGVLYAAELLPTSRRAVRQGFTDQWLWGTTVTRAKRL